MSFVNVHARHHVALYDTLAQRRAPTPLELAAYAASHGLRLTAEKEAGFPYDDDARAVWGVFSELPDEDSARGTSDPFMAALYRAFPGDGE